ncbi:proline-rich protein PRCC [Hyposmocoma kahamanoa]|uniref:proline-rich protein PRCC n=1 Tax=Hyposmocoma kahamanoa TaxID=1477025 RepID=UPI000E6D8E2A|nr:proline-rich protein PRCC [Hyposmocoma kahamanoa]
MALVAYDNSDSSEYEDEDNDNSPIAILNEHIETKDVQASSSSSDTSARASDSNSESLFTRLPQPSAKKSLVVEEDDEFLHKKEKSNIVKPKAKITVPSLSDFKDVKVTVPKPKITNGKKSGLLSILPQPKNAVMTKTISLVPQQLTKKPTATVKKKILTLSPDKKSKTNNILHNNYSDDSDNDDEVQNDFFSINKPVEIPAYDGPLDIDKPIEVVTQNKRPRSIESYFKKDVPNQVELQPDYAEPDNPTQSMDVSSNVASNYGIEEGPSYSGETAASSNNGAIVLDDEAIRQLCGARGKRKREEIQIVDVNQQEVLAEARELLMKGLMDDTTKRVSSSKKKGNEPTSQQRRKHQITYLAHKAKANEVDLQNQWANNRMSRRQTQSKYGF